MLEARATTLAELEEKMNEQSALRKSSKAARAYARTYKNGPPLVPAYIVDKVMGYISRVQLRKKKHRSYHHLQVLESETGGSARCSSSQAITS